MQMIAWTPETDKVEYLNKGPCHLTIAYIRVTTQKKNIAIILIRVLVRDREKKYKRPNISPHTVYFVISSVEALSIKQFFFSVEIIFFMHAHIRDCTIKNATPLGD